MSLTKRPSSFVSFETPWNVNKAAGLHAGRVRGVSAHLGAAVSQTVAALREFTAERQTVLWSPHVFFHKIEHSNTSITFCIRWTGGWRSPGCSSWRVLNGDAHLRSGEWISGLLEQPTEQRRFLLKVKNKKRQKGKWCSRKQTDASGRLERSRRRLCGVAGRAWGAATAGESAA